MKISGEKLRMRRKERSLTQKELANGICTPSMISQIECGKANPSEYMLQRLCARLGVSAESLKQ
jgi:transcriptional regulator with XRE-family HTH domain